MACQYGFRIVGPTWERRRLVDAGAAFGAYAACDDKAEVDREGYLSAFAFGPDFRQLLESTGSTAGFTGPCWSAWLWWDIDRADNLDAALLDARRLAAFILARYPTLDDADLLAFYSGSKGFHIGIPSSAWGPEPAVEFHRVVRRFAERIAEQAGVTIDCGVYDKVRAFRAPNSRHPKTGRHKRRLTLDELNGLTLDRILQLAERPESFDLPALTGRDEQAAADWLDAGRLIEQAAEAKAKRQAESNGTPALNRLTLDFIRDGAIEGDRHRLLFSAAANLAEFGCSPALAHALLREAALDSGLSPAEVRRQIECGLQHVGPIPPAPQSRCSAPAPLPPPPDQTALQDQLAALWRSVTPDAGPHGPERGRR